jgi:OOP family OmpA-OmpF porin
VVATALLACASGGPIVQPIRTLPEKPGPGEIVLPARSVLAFDASGSIDRKLLFPTERARVRAFVESMPPGTYLSSLIVIGGGPRDGIDFERFDRFRLELAVQRTEWRGQATPITKILDELAETLRGVDEKTVLVLWTDGVPTRYGKYIGPDEALEATDRLLAAYPGELCIHTIQVGVDERAAALLEPMAERSGCGSFHRMDELDSAERLAALQREVYIGPAPPPPPPKVRRMTDLDRDGVDDRFDRCARTPFGAHVDERGCWVVEDTVFDLDSAHIRDDRSAPLVAVREVLIRNERLRVRLDGHTDDVGSADYNMALSQRRADAVRDWLVEQGIEAGRLLTRAFGPTRPAADNDTPEGRTQNRRVEISVLDD